MDFFLKLIAGMIAVFLLLLSEQLKRKAMFNGFFYTHLISVNIFLLIYLVKTILLLANKNETLARFTKVIRVPEMIVSALFLITGVYMLTQIPEINSLMIIKIILVCASIPVAVIGYKKKKKILAILAFVLIVAAYGLAEMSKKQKTTAVTESTESSDMTSGHNIFTANCERCHGEDGKLGLMDSPDLSVSALDIKEKMEIIKNGKGAMTGFAEVLTDDQIKAVTEYTETLKK